MTHKTPPLNPLPEGEGTCSSNDDRNKGILPPSGEGQEDGGYVSDENSSLKAVTVAQNDLRGNV